MRWLARKTTIVSSSTSARISPIAVSTALYTSRIGSRRRMRSPDRGRDGSRHGDASTDARRNGPRRIPAP
jgi:hypothetical protein